METVGSIVLYLIMLSAFIGCIYSIFKPHHEIGKQFINGIDSIGSIFLPVAGIMASAPYLTYFVKLYISPLFSVMGADPSIAATTIIAIDMGGYNLAFDLALTKENFINAIMCGYMSGATIVFSIPVALKMLNKSDRPYLALGAMSGFLTIPIGVLVSSCIIMISDIRVRSVISTVGPSEYLLNMEFTQILSNLIPLVIVCLLIFFGLLYIPQKMIRGFILFGKVMESSLKLIFVLSVIEYFTGVCSYIFGSWGFEPIIADEKDINRALEISGYIGIMLCGAFPMVYIIKTYLHNSLSRIGRVFNLSSDATAGILAASANILALFAMIKDMKPEDKVKTIAYSICGAFLIGDHLAFTANFQPNLILPVLIGKFIAACLAVFIASKIAVPRIEISNDHTD